MTDPAAHRFACAAMGTTFEVTIVGEDPAYARQLAGDAFAELRRVERELSRFVPSSDVSRINRLTAGQTVRVGAATYECLRVAAQVDAATDGAFDVTVGAGLTAARAGMEMVTLSADDNAVTVGAAGVKVDLGGIGKGYAVDRIVEFLGEWGVAAALVHGGESTVLGKGGAPGGEPWTVGLRAPGSEDSQLERVRLRDRALSGSGALIHGRHIIDPRTGRPAPRAAAWASAPTGTLADALSTAFMVMADDEIERCCARLPEVGAAVLGTSALEHFGHWP